MSALTPDMAALCIVFQGRHRRTLTDEEGVSQNVLQQCISMPLGWVGFYFKLNFKTLQNNSSYNSDLVLLSDYHKT